MRAGTAPLLQAQRQIAAMIAADAADVGHSPAASTIASVRKRRHERNGSANPSTRPPRRRAAPGRRLRRHAAARRHRCMAFDDAQPLDAVGGFGARGLALSSPPGSSPAALVDPIALIARTLASSGALVRRGCAAATLQRRGSRWPLGSAGPALGRSRSRRAGQCARGAAALVPLHAVAAWKTKPRAGRSRWCRRTRCGASR
ncbi:MAG: hypothetical protein U1F67_02880 [Rubrivivax sp.]